MHRALPGAERAGAAAAREETGGRAGPRRGREAAKDEGAAAKHERNPPMAAQGTSGAPSWLFSFVDLAFLMLIAMTQIANPGAVDLGELIVPRIANEQTEVLPAGSAELWQLRVHPPASVAGPFELVRGPAGEEPERIDERELRARLAALRAEGGDKPALAPHEDSRSHDMLKAIEVLEDQWPRRRRVLVERTLVQR